MKNVSLFICLLVTVLLTTSCKKDTTTTTATADTKASMKQFSFTASNSTTYGYWLYSPKNATTNMPLIVYLHGGSGRGNDLNLVITGSLPMFLYDSTVKDIPAYILMPQCPANLTWEQITTSLIELIDKVKNDKQINPTKISLTGHSLGGTGVWKIGATNASKFSCIAPLSGSVQTNTASSFTSIPVWAFVGSADVIVDPVSSTTIVQMINSLGGNAQVKIYSGATHFDVPELVYKDASVNLLNWMISKIK